MTDTPKYVSLDGVIVPRADGNVRITSSAFKYGCAVSKVSRLLERRRPCPSTGHNGLVITATPWTTGSASRPASAPRSISGGSPRNRRTGLDQS